MGPEWIAPSVAGILALVTAAVVGFISIRNTRTGAVEQRAPSATQAWGETDRARARMFAFQDLFYTVLAALKQLDRKVKQEHPDFVLPAEVIEAMALEAPDEEK